MCKQYYKNKWKQLEYYEQYEGKEDTCAFMLRQFHLYDHLASKRKGNDKSFTFVTIFK